MTSSIFLLKFFYKKNRQLHSKGRESRGSTLLGNCPSLSVRLESSFPTVSHNSFQLLCLSRMVQSMYSSSSTPVLTLAPRRGLEPPTYRLTAECSTIELSRIIVTPPIITMFSRKSITKLIKTRRIFMKLYSLSKKVP